MFKNKWFKWVVLIVVAVVGWSFYSSSTKSIKVKAIRIGYGSIVPVINVSGEIKGNTASLSPKMGGILQSLNVKEGDVVSRGQILATLDNYESARGDFDRTKTLFDGGYATKQQLEQSKLVYESSCVISPISGTVTLVGSKIGEVVSPGMQLFSIVNNDSIYTELQIDEADISDVKAGQKVKISSDAFSDEEFEGRIVNVAAEAELKKVGGRIKMDEEDKVFRSRVVINNASSKLKVGMSVNADIIISERSGVLVVSREAIVAGNDASKIFVVQKNKIVETSVKLGAKDSVNIEILDGAKEGYDVAISELDKLKNGMRVVIDK